MLSEDLEMKNTIKSILLISIFLTQSCSIFQETECEKAFTEEMNERCLKVIHEFASNPELVYSADTLIHDVQFSIASDSDFLHDQKQFNRIKNTFDSMHDYNFEIIGNEVNGEEWKRGRHSCNIIYTILVNGSEHLIKFTFSCNLNNKSIGQLNLTNCILPTN